MYFVKIRLSVLCMTAFVLTSLYCQSSFAEEKQRGWSVAEKLFETKCSLCHSIDRPKKARKTPEEWQKTVRRMRSYAAILTDDEAKLIIDYLSYHYGIQLKPLEGK